MNAIVRLLAVYTGLSLLLCAFTRMEWSPLQPNGFGQWVALFLLIFPAAAAAEFLGERLFGKNTPPKAEESMTHSDCSWGPCRHRRAGAARHLRRRARRGLVAVAPGGVHLI